VEKTLGETGRVLIRASGTEPLIRVMVEGRDLDLVQQSAETLAATLG
jgi:phosphoglucosamine mutase